MGKTRIFMEHMKAPAVRTTIGPPYHDNLVYPAGKGSFFSKKYDKLFIDNSIDVLDRKYWILHKVTPLNINEKYPYYFDLKPCQARFRFPDRIEEQVDYNGNLTLIFKTPVGVTVHLKPIALEISCLINILFNTISCDVLPKELDDEIERGMFYPIIPFLRYFFADTSKRYLIWNEVTHRIYYCCLTSVSPQVIVGEDFRDSDTVDLVFSIIDYDATHYGIGKLLSIDNLEEIIWFTKDSVVY